jgi:Domain of unknown function (DUF4126)
MGLIEILGLAGSVSLLAGWRLYLCVFATGLAMRSGWMELPTHLESLAVLANPWVLGASFVGLIAEFFADKVAWLDSAWDAVHTLVRPLGGALLALAIVDAQDPAWQAVVFLLGGGAALLSHGGKASARAVVNASPEPVSNVVISTGEDIATASMLALALANPVIALGIALVALAFAILLIVAARRVLRGLFGTPPPSSRPRS